MATWPRAAVHPRPGRGRNRRAGRARGPPLRPPRRPRAAPRYRRGSRAAPPPARGAAAPPPPVVPQPSVGAPAPPPPAYRPPSVGAPAPPPPGCDVPGCDVPGAARLPVRRLRLRRLGAARLGAARLLLPRLRRLGSASPGGRFDLLAAVWPGLGQRRLAARGCHGTSSTIIAVPVQLRRRGRRRRLIVDTTSRLPSVWRARKSFSSYFPRRCWWTGKARVGSRATAVTIARERAVFHDAIGYTSGAPGRAKNRRTVR